MCTVFEFFISLYLTETATFYLSGTGARAGMHSGSGTKFGSESNIKWNTKLKKEIKKIQK
jgi:hypothetical protein